MRKASDLINFSKQSTLNERKEAIREDYTKFFKDKLKAWDISSPNELSDEDKKKFFSEIEKEWTSDTNESVKAKLSDLLRGVINGDTKWIEGKKVSKKKANALYDFYLELSPINKRLFDASYYSQIEKTLKKLSKTVSESKEEYQQFFKQKLSDYGVKSPDELSDEDKKKFFSEIETEWTGDTNEAKNAFAEGDLVKLKNGKQGEVLAVKGKKVVVDVEDEAPQDYKASELVLVESKITEAKKPMESEYIINFGPYQAELSDNMIYLRKGRDLVKSIDMKRGSDKKDFYRKVVEIAKKVGQENNIPFEVLLELK